MYIQKLKLNKVFNKYNKMTKYIKPIKKKMLQKITSNNSSVYFWFMSTENIMLFHEVYFYTKKRRVSKYEIYTNIYQNKLIPINDCRVFISKMIILFSEIILINVACINMLMSHDGYIMSSWHIIYLGM